MKSFHHRNTMAFCAGALTAKLYRVYGHRTDLPPVLLCMRDFKHLKTIFGKYYTLLNSYERHKECISNYEKFLSKMTLSDIELGGIDEFMIGYVIGIKPLINKKNKLISRYLDDEQK